MTLTLMIFLLMSLYFDQSQGNSKQDITKLYFNSSILVFIEFGF